MRAAAGVHRNCGRRGEVTFTFSTKGCRGAVTSRRSWLALVIETVFPACGEEAQAERVDLVCMLCSDWQRRKSAKRAVKLGIEWGNGNSSSPARSRCNTAASSRHRLSSFIQSKCLCHMCVPVVTLSDGKHLFFFFFPLSSLRVGL